MKYTVVQHSKFAKTGDEAWAKSLEPAALDDKIVEKVRKAGGSIFEDYTTADDAADKWAYGPDHEGLYGNAAQGTFSSVKVDGRAVYIPPKTLTPQEVAERVVAIFNEAEAAGLTVEFSGNAVFFDSPTEPQFHTATGWAEGDPWVALGAGQRLGPSGIVKL